MGKITILRTLYIIVILSLLLMGCESEGDRKVKVMRAQAEVEATRQATETERLQAEAAAARAAADWESTRQAFNSAKNTLARALGWGLALTILLGSAIILYKGYRLLGHVNKRAEVWSLSVPLDPKTGQYPLLLLKGAVHDPNTGMVLQAGQAREALEQLAAGAHYSRALGVATQGAVAIGAKSKDVQAVEGIYAAAGGIPQIRAGPLARERETVQDSGLPDWMKRRMDDALAKKEETMDQAVEGVVIDG